MTSKMTRRRMLVVATPLVCVAWTALLVAPSPAAQPAYAADVRPPASAPETVDDAAAVADAMASAVTPGSGSDADSTPAPEEADAPADKGGRFAISDVVMVVNDDGSATLSATFRGGREPMALKSVHIESDAGGLPIASTLMWLPIFPGTESRAGDASDAGGFVVPRGLTPGQTVRVQFQFDNDTCASTDAQTVRRSSAHDEVFPNTGDQLGPGRATSSMAECPEAG